MEAKLIIKKSPVLKLALTFLVCASMACSKKNDAPINAEDKAHLLSSASVLQKKGYCLPNPILDEEDIPALVGDGYKLSPADQYCIPEDGAFPPSDYNCVPHKFVDAQDLIYLIGNGYHDTGVEYCNNVVQPEEPEEPGTTNGSTTGGSTDAGSTDGGGATNGSTNGSVNGGSTDAGSTDGGATNGSTNGSTNVGSTDGGATNGSVNGGSIDAGSTDGGATNGSTNGSTNGETTAGSTDGGGATNGSTNGSTNGETTAGNNDGGNGGDGEPAYENTLDRMCSKMRTGNGRYILENREKLVIQVVQRIKDSKTRKYVNTVICEESNTARIKKNILDKRSVVVPRCDIRKYKKSDLYITIFSPVVATDLPISSTNYNDVRFFEENSDVKGKDVLSFINYGSRSNRYVKITEKIVVIIDNNPDYDKTVNKKRCDQKASPLIVHVNPDHDVADYVKLTSIAKGVKFDILGFNAEPVPYAQKKIGWLANKTQYMFLVKPDYRGRVNGVDQMFGDNTMGPDKDFAANGFLALAKYDKNGDGIIDSDDKIYHELRLWNDKNLDGKGTPNEMLKLSQMKVKAIDLDYDASFREKDKYGNETVYKSVIKYNDGSLDLIFDLWFAYE